MGKVFHQRFTFLACFGILIFSLLALYLFCIKAVAFAILVTMAVVGMASHGLATYVFEPSPQGEALVIHRGWFARKRVICVNEIVRATRERLAFGLAHYILIEYGARHFVSVTPAEEEAFLREIKERQDYL